jgi:hypothetical protein
MGIPGLSKGSSAHRRGPLAPLRRDSGRGRYRTTRIRADEDAPGTRPK